MLICIRMCVLRIFCTMCKFVFCAAGLCEQRKWKFEARGYATGFVCRVENQENMSRGDVLPDVWVAGMRSRMFRSCCAEPTDCRRVGVDRPLASTRATERNRGALRRAPEASGVERHSFSGALPRHSSGQVAGFSQQRTPRSLGGFQAHSLAANAR